MTYIKQYMNCGDHNVVEITQQTKLRVALVLSNQSSSTCRVERVQLCCSTMSTQPKCIGLTCRTCRVESCRVEPSGICAIFCGVSCHESTGPLARLVEMFPVDGVIVQLTRMIAKRCGTGFQLTGP